VGVDEIEAIIRRDPVIAARVVSAANAVAYASPVPTTSIGGALMRLGLARVRRLTLLVSLYNALPLPPDLQQAFWRHSLAVAPAADVVARHAARSGAAANPEPPFLAGLLHDLGLLVLTSRYPEELAAARAAFGTYRALDEAERQVLGIDHAEIGARLAQSWTFSGEIVSAIRWHHRPSLAPASSRTTAAIVGIADAVCAGDPVIDLEEGGAAEADASFTGLGFEAEARTALVDEARDRALRGAASIAGLL
jgi:putative nucleotidyltransferase with HDIG domain